MARFHEILRRIAPGLLSAGIALGGVQEAQASKSVEDTSRLNPEQSVSYSNNPSANAVSELGLNQSSRDFHTLPGPLADPEGQQLSTGAEEVAQKLPLEQNIQAAASNENEVLSPEPGQVVELTPVQSNVCEQLGMPFAQWERAVSFVIPADVNIRTGMGLNNPLTTLSRETFASGVIATPGDGGWFQIWGNANGESAQAAVAGFVLPESTTITTGLCAVLTDTPTAEERAIPEGFTLVPDPNAGATESGVVGEEQEQAPDLTAAPISAPGAPDGAAATGTAAPETGDDSVENMGTLVAPGAEDGAREPIPIYTLSPPPQPIVLMYPTPSQEVLNSVGNSENVVSRTRAIQQVIEQQVFPRIQQRGSFNPADFAPVIVNGQELGLGPVDAQALGRGVSNPEGMRFSSFLLAVTDVVRAPVSYNDRTVEYVFVTLQGINITMVLSYAEGGPVGSNIFSAGSNVESLEEVNDISGGGDLRQLEDFYRQQMNQRKSVLASFWNNVVFSGTDNSANANRRAQDQRNTGLLSAVEEGVVPPQGGVTVPSAIIFFN